MYDIIIVLCFFTYIMMMMMWGSGKGFIMHVAVHSWTWISPNTQLDKDQCDDNLCLFCLIVNYNVFKSYLPLIITIAFI